MRLIAVFACFFALSGCSGSVIGDRLASPEKLAQQDDAYCTSVGLRFGTPEYANCRMQTTQRREDRHAAAVQSFSDTLSSGPVDRTPQQTTCQRIGNTTNCTTY
jgi:hypothetical protein